MATSPTPKLRVKQAVDQYGIGERYLRHLIAEKRITVYKVGRNVYLDPVDLDALFDEGKQEATN